MPVDIEAVETLFTVEAIKQTELGAVPYVILAGGGERFEVAAGDTFHIAYNGKVGLWPLLVSWLTGVPLSVEARERCNCRWDKKI